MPKINLTFKNTLISAVIIITTLVAPNAFATNGLFGLGYGARQNGIAGSGVAFPQDPLIAAINPAGVVFLDKQTEINLQYFSPSREYTIADFTVESDSENFFIPSVGFSWPISSEASLGLAIYGNGGMNTDYASHDTPGGAGTFGGDHTGVNYAQIFTNLNYSRKFADGKASWGIGAVLNYSYIRMNGLKNFGGFSNNSDNLTNQGYDHAFGIGLRLGVLGDIATGIRLGASYQTKIKNTFDDYRGLFPHKGEFDIPANAQIGVAADIGSGVFTFDIQQIQYSESDAIGNTSRTLMTGGKLGDNVGFGWDNMTIYKAGYTWSTNDKWTWRVGASYGEQPIPDSEVTFSILATGVIEQHFTAGFSKVLDNGKEVNVAFMYAPEKCVTGNHLLNPANSNEICMKQFSVDVGMSF